MPGYEAVDPKTGKKWTWDGKQWNAQEAPTFGKTMLTNFGESIGLHAKDDPTKITWGNVASQQLSNIQKAIEQSYKQSSKVAGPILGAPLAYPNLIANAVESMASGAETTGKGLMEAIRTKDPQKLAAALGTGVGTAAMIISSMKAPEQIERVPEVARQGVQSLAGVGERTINTLRAKNEAAQAALAQKEQLGTEVQQHASEISTALPLLREQAVANAKAAYPKVSGAVDAATIQGDVQAAIDAKLRGVGRVPSVLSGILEKTKPQPSELEQAGIFRGAGQAARRGNRGMPANEAISVMPPAARARFLESLSQEERGKIEGPPSGDETFDFDKLHGIYSEMGRAVYDRNLPGDERAAIVEARKNVLLRMKAMAAVEDKLPQFMQAQKGWAEMENTFNNSKPISAGGSPIAHALKAMDPITKKLRPDYVQAILADSKAYNVAQEHLGRYERYGGKAVQGTLQDLKEKMEKAKAIPARKEVKPFDPVAERKAILSGGRDAGIGTRSVFFLRAAIIGRLIRGFLTNPRTVEWLSKNPEHVKDVGRLQKMLDAIETGFEVPAASKKEQ